MKFYVYVLENQHKKRYIGYTSNIDARIARHNNSGSFWTKNKGPWKLIYKEEFLNKIEAIKREKFLKRQKGGEGLKKMINKI